MFKTVVTSTSYYIVPWAQDGEVFETVVTDINAGGLLATLGALPGFIPFSLMLKNDAKRDAWQSPEVSPPVPPLWERK